MTSALRKVFKRLHFPLEVMLTCVRRYVAYPLSLRGVQEMMRERGVCVDHSTVHNWAMKILPVLAVVFRRRKLAVGKSRRMDETYIKFNGCWKYLYRAVDRGGQTIVPEKITTDKSGANTTAVHSLIDHSRLAIELRQSKYLNNIVEQDHRAIKRRTRSMMGFKSFARPPRSSPASKPCT